MNSATATATSPTAPPPAPDERRASIDAALGNVRASITILDDEAHPTLGWTERDELIALLREAVRELRKL